MITRPTKIEKWFCVWDLHYGDFIESFATAEDAREWCRKSIKGNPNYLHHYAVGKWISVDSDDYEQLEEIKNY